MTLHALIGPGDAVLRVEDNIDPNAGTKPGYRWVPVEDDHPSHNSATQVITGPVNVVEANRLIRRWTVRDKTAQELAAEADQAKEAKLDAVAEVAFTVLFNHENRIRTLEQRPTVTAAQFRAALKAML